MKNIIPEFKIQTNFHFTKLPSLLGSLPAGLPAEGMVGRRLGVGYRATTSLTSQKAQTSAPSPDTPCTPGTSPH